MSTISRKAVGISAVALVTAGLIAGTAESASAATITLAYSTQAACQAGEAQYVAQHWRITSGCTWYFDVRPNLTPWMFTATR
jgi:hypothetical protein